MIINSTNIKDVFVIQPSVYSDKRGYFYESFNKRNFQQKFSMVDFCQDNESQSTFGVLRGLHYQLPPKAQTKLVRVIKGRVLDIALDIRKGSPTFGEHISVELSDENKRQLFIPRGFAHGFVVLSDLAIFSYKVDNYYDSRLERGIIYNDKDLNIDWKLKDLKLNISMKDKNLSSFKDAEFFKYSKNQYD